MSFWSGVSVVIITLDAADVLVDALRSIPGQAEVIVADGGSADATTSLAHGHGARVVAQDLAAIAKADGNFDVARNHAARQASREWVFFLDADERFTPDLVGEIQELERRDSRDAFEMPRINLFWGKPVRLLGQDLQTRLVRRGRGRFEGTALHAKMEVDGAVGRLGSPLLHENLRSWMDVKLRFRRYLPSEARHHPPVSSRHQAVMHGCRMFRHYYFRSGAWRDGWRGIIVCLIYSVYHGAAAWQSRRYRDA